MLMVNRKNDQERTGERGSVMIFTAISMVTLFLMLGLCIDISRIYMVRTELQNAADAAALAAVKELNGGKPGIIKAGASANNIVNNFGFGKAPVELASVEYAVNLNGSYMDQDAAENDPEKIRFIRVTTETATTSILFAVKALGSTNTQQMSATAGMSVGINTICDFFPMAVALPSPYPSPGDNMTLNFTEGTGNSATLLPKDYITLEVPEISGNGVPETAMLAAGITDACLKLGDQITLHMTPSSNQNNGPQAIADGTNTRFNMYEKAYGNSLNPSDFPPDSNVKLDITFDEYTKGTNVLPPSSNGPGEAERRILVVPIVAPGTYDPPHARLGKWAAFFLKRPVLSDENPCTKAGGRCAHMDVEWIDETLVLGSGYFDPYTPETSLTVPVLYR
jgi:Flp pilus assembly protein TadG